MPHTRRRTGVKVVVERDNSPRRVVRRHVLAYHRVARSFPRAYERLFPGRGASVPDRGCRRSEYLRRRGLLW